MGLFEKSSEDKLMKLRVVLEEFMTTTVKSLEEQNRRIETLTEICEIMTGKASEAQDQKIAILKKAQDALTEKMQTLEELVSSNARNNIQMMADMEGLAKMLMEVAGRNMSNPRDKEDP